MIANNTTENLTACTGDYAKALRAIGYALEALDVEEFELTCRGKNYIVRVANQRTKKPRMKYLLKLKGLQTLQHISLGDQPIDNRSAGLQLIYTPEDIERLQHEGQSRRRNGGKPDPHSLPQALRATGAYVLLKAARLLQIFKHGPLITIRYETARDCCNTEQLTPSALYAFVCTDVREEKRPAKIK